MKIINSNNISSFIEKNAVFVIVYKEQKNTFPIEMLYTTQYPTLFFLDKYKSTGSKKLFENYKIDSNASSIVLYFCAIKRYTAAFSLANFRYSSDGFCNCSIESSSIILSHDFL